MKKDDITIEDFSKLDIKIGTITSAEKVESSEKLVKLTVDLGEEKERQILSGIAKHFPEPEILVGRQVPVLVNLPARKMMGFESQGMVLYVVGEDFLFTLEPREKNLPPGTSVK